LNRENDLIPGADTFDTVEGNTEGHANASARPARRGRVSPPPWRAVLLSPRGAARPLKQKAIRRNAPPRSPQSGERLYVRRVIIGRKD